MRDKIMAICKTIDSSIDFESDALVDAGVLDSVTLIEIVSELMEAFELDIPYEEIKPENFNSIDAMKNLVERYV